MGANEITFSFSRAKEIHFLGVSFLRFPCHSLPQKKVDVEYFTTMNVKSDWLRCFPAESGGLED